MLHEEQPKTPTIQPAPESQPAQQTTQVPPEPEQPTDEALADDQRMLALVMKNHPLLTREKALEQLRLHY